MSRRLRVVETRIGDPSVFHDHLPWLDDTSDSQPPVRRHSFLNPIVIIATIAAALIIARMAYSLGYASVAIAG